MTITPEMLNAESVEKAAEELRKGDLWAENWEVRAAITAYLNAEVEAGRGNKGYSWQDGEGGLGAHANPNCEGCCCGGTNTPALILRLEK